MSNPSAPFGLDRHLLRLDKDPYLCLHFVIVYVRDQERAKKFYVDTLGFKVAVDHTFENGQRWVEVIPPDGTANIGLAPLPPDEDPAKFIQPNALIWFITEDVNSKYDEWKARGVKFDHPPEVPKWGGIHTRFTDPDGNAFGLAGFDELTSTIESQRRILAKKYEAERRAEQEMEIAKQVQARLFPQCYPEAKTLEYAGVCVQARHVGGDYFDFLDLGQRHLGLVVGDVSGKGIAAALLMANLQANLRSQGAQALANPTGFLRSVNRLFYNNSADSSFASLFFAMYDDASRKLRYANCGHLAGLVLHPDKTCERLPSTGTLLGLFRDWECSIGECQLNPGDMLALYTDGVTEAHKDSGEEFGECALIDALHQHRSGSCEAALNGITRAVRDFNPTHQHDDITLIIAKCRDAA
jgi:serine phosphatase RsbU (regulator of sigma subunit)/catechol 2,3-dioxygenase-like lactoylglutathione lyase family enzyme